ncbi:MAG TPA: hypothetical protein DER10_06530 [Elusimicrobia bacterium]|nr:MAG: hypothetical protein A2X33_07005 [Elusimicrobia bacterium GWA2_51_34]HAF95476.1 hypothetical protein [Elusimicrobiota bacterium]HCE98138.1 hypothetical protein [Elusimicrobiota bacterium]
MKNFFLVFAAGAALFCAVPARAANLTGQGISTNDNLGAERTTFSNTETITLRQKVNNTVSISSSIVFVFSIISPAGAEGFRHEGNSAPGTAGGAQTQLSGISISSFYTVPGSYIFRGKATLGTETVTQEARFTISSPNINLIYPPYGARGLSDNPLMFRWIASGASRYRITVSDSAGLYNPVHTAVNSGESLYSYPENPSQPREQLVADQVYYWKVEGLDSSNNKIAESNIYNFSLKAQASSQSRNIMVSALELSSPALDFTKPLNFKVTVFNTGSSAESNIGVRLSLGGLSAQDSPKQIMFISPGEKKEVLFTAFMPSDQQESLAVACVDVFDDNIPDNCKTMLFSKNTGVPPPLKEKKKLTYDEMFAAITKRLGPDAAKSLEGYTFESLNCANCSADELAAIISALISGDAQLVNASVLDAIGDATAAAAAAPNSSASAAQLPAAGEEGPETQLDVQALPAGGINEWTGYTEAFQSPEAVSFAIRNRKEWKKVWKTLSSEDTPDVNFDEKMVVGVVSGSKDRAETVRLSGKRKTDTGVAFDYYMIEAPEGVRPPLPAYIFKVYDRSDEKAEFKRLDVLKR